MASLLPPGANEVGAMLADIKARTGWGWADVGAQVGMTAEYARKLATKPVTAGAGKAFRSNVERFKRTGAAQRPVQREQKVRQAKGAPSAPAPRRAPAAPRSGFKVERTTFAGPGKRDGYKTRVTCPQRKTKTGDREDARHAIMAATRKAAQGRRTVAFQVTYKDSNGRAQTVEVGTGWGYNASDALRRMKAEGNDPFEWFVSQGLERYVSDEDAPTAADIVAVDVIVMP